MLATIWLIWIHEAIYSSIEPNQQPFNTNFGWEKKMGKKRKKRFVFLKNCIANNSCKKCIRVWLNGISGKFAVCQYYLLSKNRYCELQVL